MKQFFSYITMLYLNMCRPTYGLWPEIKLYYDYYYYYTAASGDTLCSEPFLVGRGVIQGDIFSPQCFTLGLDRIFRLQDIAGQGIGGPSLCDVTASKLEYADDVGLLDWTAGGLGACLCAGEWFASIRLDGDVGTQVEGHARAYPGTTTSVDGSGR